MEEEESATAREGEKLLFCLLHIWWLLVYFVEYARRIQK